MRALASRCCVRAEIHVGHSAAILTLGVGARVKFGFAVHILRTAGGYAHSYAKSGASVTSSQNVVRLTRPSE